MFVEVDRDIVALVYDQLPHRVRDILTVRLKTDPYLLRAEALFTDANGRTTTCFLEPFALGAVTVNCRIPDATLALLCVQT